MAKEAKWSKGPWRIGDDRFNRVILLADNISLMCDEQYYPWTPDNYADWVLISKAPEMADLLREIANSPTIPHVGIVPKCDVSCFRCKAERLLTEIESPANQGVPRNER